LRSTCARPGLDGLRVVSDFLSGRVAAYRLAMTEW